MISLAIGVASLGICAILLTLVGNRSLAKERARHEEDMKRDAESSAKPRDAFPFPAVELARQSQRELSTR